ncbi:sterol desaturase family protein [Pseudorhodobacter sp.]|uniref:sterol desaturase family protein n=1 Tax=Pseudorhodobacter sp. TaxID=1934400 RepID=UPI002649F53E|nr:sterol desaturase family protein [Pseudorhodobacter sp.]MDN5787060.1 fatty acid hydroxylase [Pseudorhodobacter sp.]
MARLSIMYRHLAVQVMTAIMLGAAIWLAVIGPFWAWAFVIFGIPAQMLNEYSLHRYIFHLAPPRQQWAFDLLYQAHYGHHDFPTNQRLFFVPIWVALPVLCTSFAVTWAALHFVVPAFALPVAVAIVPVGGIATFLGYEWFHMTAHLPVPKTAVERHVTTLHNQHHFRDFSRWFHVSPGGEVIDRVMGTAIDREALKSQQRIEFIRTLGMRPDDVRLIAARQRFASTYGLSSVEIARAASG